MALVDNKKVLSNKLVIRKLFGSSLQMLELFCPKSEFLGFDKTGYSLLRGRDSSTASTRWWAVEKKPAPPL